MSKKFKNPKRKPDIVTTKVVNHDVAIYSATITYRIWYKERLFAQDYKSSNDELTFLNTTLYAWFGYDKAEGKWMMMNPERTYSVYIEIVNKAIETWLNEQIEKEIFDG